MFPCRAHEPDFLIDARGVAVGVLEQYPVCVGCVGELSCDECFLGGAIEFRNGGIGEEQHAVVVAGEDHVRHEIDDGAQICLALLVRCMRPPALGDLAPEVGDALAQVAAH